MMNRRLLWLIIIGIIAEVFGAIAAFPQAATPLHRIAAVSASPSGKFVYASTGVTFTPEGNNYVKLDYRPDISPWPFHVTFNIGFYDASAAESALSKMHEDGYNIVRVWISAGGEPHQSAGQYGVAGPYSTNIPNLYQPYMDNFMDFLRRANAHHVYVIPVLDFTPTNSYYDSLTYSNVPANVEGWNLLFMGQGAIDAKKTYVSQFVSAINAADPNLLSTIFSYELQNELFADVNQRPFNLSSGSIATADGGIYGMADPGSRQNCQDSNTINWANQLSSAIHNEDGKAMVSTSVFTFRAAGKPGGPNGLLQGYPDTRYPARPLILDLYAGGLAYIDIHMYPSPSGYSMDDELNSSQFPALDKTAKPFLMSEFGASVSLYPNISNAAYAMKVHRQNAYDRGFAGSLFWTWDTPASDHHNVLESNGAINGQLAPITRGASNNPIEDARFFVYQQYLDFLNRDPDSQGLDYWAGQITQCGTDSLCVLNKRTEVSQAFFQSQEFQQTGFYVSRFYRASFGLQPSYAQFTDDHSMVLGGANLDASKAAFAENWIQRPEFIQRYPSGMTADQFVDALLTTVTQTDGVDLSYRRVELVNSLNTGASRGYVVRQLLEDQSFASAEYNSAFVLVQYFGYLRRNPDSGGYQFWLNNLNSNGNAKGMVCAFATSAEYELRFGFSVGSSDCGSIN